MIEIGDNLANIISLFAQGCIIFGVVFMAGATITALSKRDK
jgi:hypothetical protein